MKLRVALLAAILSAPLPVTAGELTLSFNNGRVTLKATDVTLRQVLAEWARIGKTRIVGVEKLSGQLITLQLDNVPEKKALEILLRSVAGYAVAMRPEPAAGASFFDRVALLPTSVASAAPAAAPPRPAATFAPPPMTPATMQPQPFPDPIQLANEESGQHEPASNAVPPGGEPARMVMPSADVLPPPPGINQIGPDQPPALPLPDGTSPMPTATGPTLAGRPGVIPMPQTPQQTPPQTRQTPPPQQTQKPRP